MKPKFLNKLIVHSMAAMIVGALFVLAGCKDDDEPAPTQTILEIVESTDNLTILKGVLTDGLKTTLGGTAAVTLFAPSDAAMTTLLKTLFGNTATDPALFSSVAPAIIQSVLAYHVANSELLSSALTEGLEVTTQQGEKIKVVVTTTGEKKLDTGATSDALIETADLRATNGVVHIVDVVLVPPTIGAQIIATLGKVAQPVLLSSSFTTLAAAIAKADAGKPVEQTIVGALIATPASPGITVFAPVNDVFKAASITVDTYDAATWNSIIRGHIVVKSLATLASGSETSMSGKTITIATGTPSTVKGTANSAGVPIVAAGVQATNGIVYPIGGVIQHIP